MVDLSESISTQAGQVRETPDKVRIPLSIREHAGLARQGEPVVAGVALPRGLASDTGLWQLRIRESHAPAPCQLAPLAHWHDGSVKWLSITFFAGVNAGQSLDFDLYLLDDQRGENSNGAAHHNGEVRAPLPTSGAVETPTWQDGRIELRDTSAAFEVCSDQASFSLPRSGTRLVERVRIASRDLLGDGGIRFECLDAHGRLRNGVIESTHVEQVGPLKVDLGFEGRVERCGGLRVAGKLSIFGPNGLMRIEATLHNPSRAKHPGGCWDLGDPGSVLLQGWRLNLDLANLNPGRVQWMEHAAGPTHGPIEAPLGICQYSSGGENWRSRNHVNRRNTVPLRMRGFRTRADGVEREGLRASPIVSVHGAAGTVSCALTEFWEKFPSAVQYDGERLLIEFWPDDFGDLHELQAGEHCTRVVWLRFDEPGKGNCQDLSWVHEPLTVHVDSEWLSASSAIPWLPAGTARYRPELKQLMDGALSGPESIFSKREAIDEYGWRNYGDVWADHETAYYSGPTPIISHYNNQYDLLYGLLIQFLLTGDRRWWQLADPLARHVMDIDVYHTAHDKAGYSGGLFWHTAHYLDAGTCTHRTYSQRMNGPSGGPANEHAYTAGLLLYYHLTGDTRARDTVLRLAEWIIALDDGSQHLFGLLSDAPTGRASCTTAADYHGPGRGAGNAIGVLLDAWLAGGDARFVDFAEELIRRTVHPEDDVAARSLNDFERRWSYTVFLQQLARYLHLTAGVERPGRIRNYVLRSLLHYADWMVENDEFYFDFPERLEYPTETWAAQELRKGNVLMSAADYGNALQQDRFRRRGQETFDRAWAMLLSFETRLCTRPLALVLQQGYVETFYSTIKPEVISPDETCIHELPPPTNFVPQVAQIRAALKSPRGALSIGLRMARPKRWQNVWRRSWPAERLRGWITSIRQ